jgi:hypothetical protein
VVAGLDDMPVGDDRAAVDREAGTRDDPVAPQVAQAHGVGAYRMYELLFRV